MSDNVTKKPFSNLPLHEKLAIGFTKGLGLLLGLAFIVILILGMTGGL